MQKKKKIFVDCSLSAAPEMLFCHHALERTQDPRPRFVAARHATLLISTRKEELQQ